MKRGAAIGSAAGEVARVPRTAKPERHADTSPRRRAASLSSNQIRPRSRSRTDGQPDPTKVAKLKYAKNGRWGQLKIPGNGSNAERKGVRSAITHFSARSRGHLLAQVNSVDRSKCQPGDFKFGTLTYPSDWPTARASKSHLKALIKRLERSYGEMPGWWKIEAQKRGAPHFHLLLFFPGVDVGELASFAAHAWNELCCRAMVLSDADAARHLRVHLGLMKGKGGRDDSRPCFEVVRDWDGMARYAAKYLGKVEDTSLRSPESWKNPGRFWGKLRAKNLPITMNEVELSARAAAILRRACIGWWESQASGRLVIQGKTLSRGGFLRGHTVKDVKAEPGKPSLREMCNDCDQTVREQKRRWRPRRGGFRGFIPSEVVERLVAYAIDASLDPGPGKAGNAMRPSRRKLITRETECGWTPEQEAEIRAHAGQSARKLIAEISAAQSGYDFQTLTAQPFLINPTCSDLRAGNSTRR